MKFECSVRGGRTVLVVESEVVQVDPRLDVVKYLLVGGLGELQGEKLFDLPWSWCEEDRCGVADGISAPQRRCGRVTNSTKHLESVGNL